MYSLETWFFSGIYVRINTLHKGDNEEEEEDADDNNNNNNTVLELLTGTKKNRKN
jgi:hypothetical protein